MLSSLDAPYAPANASDAVAKPTKEASKPEFWTAARRMLGLAFLLWVAVGLVAFTSGYVEPGTSGNGLTVVETFYLMTQIVLTVGYGDLTPVTDFGMVFTALYALSSGLLLSGLISECVDYFVRHDKMNSEKMMTGLFEEADPVAENSFWEQNRRLFSAAFLFAMAVVVWMLFFMYYCAKEDGVTLVCEEMPLVKAFYFAVISVSTVGFGDVTPSTQGGDVFATIGLFVGFGAYANLVAAITDRIQNVKQAMHMHSIEAEELEMADSSSDGQVDLYEFTRFILARYDLVPGDLLDRIKRNFHELDADGSGHLNMEDVKLLCQKHSNNNNTINTGTQSSVISRSPASRSTNATHLQLVSKDEGASLKKPA